MIGKKQLKRKRRQNSKTGDPKNFPKKIYIFHVFSVIFQLPKLQFGTGLEIKTTESGRSYRLNYSMVQPESISYDFLMVVYYFVCVCVMNKFVCTL